MWAYHFRHCQRCKTTKHKHRCRGYCEVCWQYIKYHSDDKFRKNAIARARKWQDKNREKVLARMREYGRKYYQLKKIK